MDNTASNSVSITRVAGGTFRLDGGSMFGVVPKLLWQHATDCDERNRIPMATNCLYVKAGDVNILVDTGYGGKAPQKIRDMLLLEPGEPLLLSLKAIDVAPESIDIVILTHLHFDHAGGGTRIDNGKVVPTFPNAKYVVQRDEWEDATAQLPELAGAYFRKDFEPIAEAGQLEIIEGERVIVPGVTVMRVPGHTRGMQIVGFERGEQSAVFLADLCPTTAHLKTFWTMSYDQNLLEVRRAKPAVLNWAVNQGAMALFEHDPKIWAAHLKQDSSGTVSIASVHTERSLWEEAK